MEKDPFGPVCWRVGSPTGGPFPSSSLVQSPSAVDATAQSAHARSTHHARPLPPPPGPSWRPLIGSWTADIPLQTLTPPCQYVMQIRGATWHFWCTDPLQGWPKVPARRGCGQRSPGAHCGGGGGQTVHTPLSFTSRETHTPQPLAGRGGGAGRPAPGREACQSPYLRRRSVEAPSEAHTLPRTCPGLGGRVWGSGWVGVRACVAGQLPRFLPPCARPWITVCNRRPRG